MNDFFIDWDNLPICGAPKIVISSAYCREENWTPPVDTPTPVPVPGTLLLFGMGLALIGLAKRKEARNQRNDATGNVQRLDGLG